MHSLIPGTLWRQSSPEIIVQVVHGPFCKIFPDFSKESNSYPMIRPIKNGDIPRRFVKFTISPFVSYRYLKGVEDKFVGKVTYCYASSFLYHKTLIEDA